MFNRVFGLLNSQILFSCMSNILKLIEIPTLKPYVYFCCSYHDALSFMVCEHVPMVTIFSSYTLLSSWLIWKWLKSSSLTIDILAAHVKQTEFYVGLKSSSPPLYFQSGQIYVNQIPSHPGRPLFEYCIKCLIGTRLFKRKMSFSSFLFILMKNAKFLRPSIVHVNDWHSQSYISKRLLEKFWNQVCFYRTSSFFSWWYETTEDIDVEKIT